VLKKNTRFNKPFKINIYDENDDRDNIFGISTYVPGSCDSSIGIAAGYGLEGWGFVRGRGKMFLLRIIQTGSEAHPASYPVGTVVSFPESKVAGDRSSKSK
jgi:hypothetical protein